MKVQLDPKIFEPTSPLQPRRASAKDFSEVLKEAIKEVNRLQLEADKAMEDLALGKGDLHNTIIAESRHLCSSLPRACAHFEEPHR